MKFFSIILLTLTGFFAQVGIANNDILSLSLEPVEIVGDFFSSFAQNNQQPRQEAFKKPAETLPTFFALFNEVEWEEEEDNREDKDVLDHSERIGDFNFSGSHLPVSALFQASFRSNEAVSALPFFILFEVYRL